MWLMMCNHPDPLIGLDLELLVPASQDRYFVLWRQLELQFGSWTRVGVLVLHGARCDAAAETAHCHRTDVSHCVPCVRQLKLHYFTSRSPFVCDLAGKGTKAPDRDVAPRRNLASCSGSQLGRLGCTTAAACSKTRATKVGGKNAINAHPAMYTSAQKETLQIWLLLWLLQSLHPKPGHPRETGSFLHVRWSVPPTFGPEF